MVIVTLILEQLIKAQDLKGFYNFDEPSTRWTTIILVELCRPKRQCPARVASYCDGAAESLRQKSRGIFYNDRTVSTNCKQRLTNAPRTTFPTNSLPVSCCTRGNSNKSMTTKPKSAAVTFYNGSPNPPNLPIDWNAWLNTQPMRPIVSKPKPTRPG